LMKKKKKIKGKMARRRATTNHVVSSVRTERARMHSVSIGSPGVIEFGDPALREAFRIWWHPYDMGTDFDELTGQDGRVIRIKRTKRGGHGSITRVPAKHPVMSGDSIERRKLDPGYYRRIDRAMRSMRVVSRKTSKSAKPFRRMALPSARPAPVKVVITLTYPLSEKRSKVVTIDRRYPGEIFALTNDFYRELYAEDERAGGKAGPMNGGAGPLLNRGRGPLIWGHDLGDLVFESCKYRAFDEATKKKLLTKAEGEFTFGIGS